MYRTVVLVFSFFVLFATSLDHVGWYMVATILYAIAMLVYVFWYRRRYTMLFLICIPLVVFVSITRFHHRSPSVISDDGFSFVGTGTIIGTMRNQRYLFESSGETFIVDTDTQLTLGDEMYILGRLERTLPSSFFSQYTLRKMSLPAVLSGSFDYHRWLWMKGYAGTIYASQLVATGESITSGVLATKRVLQDRLGRLYTAPDVRALVGGMLIGDIADISQTRYQDIVDAGLVHIVAVSGSNMVMVIVFLHLLLFFLPYYMRIGCIALFLVWYAWLCGMDSSVLRALLMGLLTLFALVLGKTQDTKRIVAIVYSAMLLRNPYSLLYDLGFVLSFAALLGIIYSQELLAPYKARLPKGVRYLLRAYIIPTCGATLGVLPFLLFFVGTTNILTIGANALVLPIVPFVMIFSLLSLVSGWTRVVTLVHWCIMYIYSVVDMSVSWSVYMMSTTVLAKYVMLCGLLLIYSVVVWRVRQYRQNVENDTTSKGISE